MVKAEDILADILAGKPVKCNNEKIEGDLDLSKLNLPRNNEGRVIVAVPIEITNSKIEGRANFGNLIFQEKVDFSKTNFSGDAHFVRALFSYGANFRETLFCGSTYFWRTQFNGYANFCRTQFNGHTYFWSALFSDSTYFNETLFCGTTYFYTTLFRGDAEFWGAQFGGDAYFQEAQFSSYALFAQALFSGSANFWRTQFSSDVYFQWALFTGSANLQDAQFGGDAYFQEARFNGSANLQGAHFSGDAQFRETLFGGSTYFMNAEFNNKIHLTRSKFDRLYINWSSIRHNLVYDGPAYLALIKNFKTIERFGDADACYYQYRKESQDRKRLHGEENGWDWSKFSDIASWISCGYGVRPIHTVICMLCIVVIGGVIFIGSSESLFESAYFSVMTFTGGDPDNLTLGRWLRTVAMIEAILSYLFMALFVVVLGRKFIR